MPVVTRSTTRVSRPQTVYAKPAPAARTVAKSASRSSKTASKPPSKAATQKKLKMGRKPVAKQASKVLDTAEAAAIWEAEKAKRAEKMRREWEDIVAARPPLKSLGPADLTGSDEQNPPPHRLYGWPFSEEYMLEYARRHHLGFAVHPDRRQRFGGKDEFDFADLTPEQLADEKMLPSLQRMATIKVIAHIRSTKGAMLKVDQPVSLDWQWMLVIWTTDDVEEKYARYKRLGEWETIETFVNEAMNECLPEGSEKRTSLEWWWSREKNKLR